MKRISIVAAMSLAVVVGVMLNVQQTLSADGAIVIKNDGLCGMAGADENGDMVIGGIGLQTTKVENGDKVMLKCKGTDITNDSGRGQKFSGFLCGVFDAEGTLFLTEDTHATVSASGVGTLTCTYLK